MVQIPFLTEAPQIAYVRRASTALSESAGDGASRGDYRPPVVDESGALAFAGAMTLPPRREAGEAARTSLSIRPIGKQSEGSTLKVLPRPRRLATEYEPHLTHRTTEGLLSLFESFSESLGSAAAPARAAELRLRLADAYRNSVARPETRDFATAISMLQDLLRPHWSKIPAPKLELVSERLRRLDSEKDLTPLVLTKFYAHLSADLGSGITLEINDGEEDSGEAGEVPE